MRNRRLVRRGRGVRMCMRMYMVRMHACALCVHAHGPPGHGTLWARGRWDHWDVAPPRCSVPGGTAVNWMIPGWLPLQGPVHRGYPGASALICDHLRGGGTPGVPMGPAPRRLLPESPRIAKPGAGANPVCVSWMGPAGLHGTCTIGPAPPYRRDRCVLPRRRGHTTNPCYSLATTADSSLTHTRCRSQIGGPVCVGAHAIQPQGGYR